MKKALITGIAGQDGSYLAELLLAKGYEVHGIVRPAALEDPERRLWRLLPFKQRLRLHAASVESFATIHRVVAQLKPHECYHLAAQRRVGASFEDEFSTLNANIDGVHHVLSAIRDWAPTCRFFFAGSAEMFGAGAESPQNERTPLRPRSAYGISKAAGFHLTCNYRESHGLKAWSGILYEHESPRRGYEFISRQITAHVARIKLKVARELKLANLEARRDWGDARDYVAAMWRMLQSETPDDYVIATGEAHSVGEFVAAAFAHAGLDWQKFVKVEAQPRQAAQGEPLLGDAAKARRALGWSARTAFTDLAAEMVDEDLRLLKRRTLGLLPAPRAIARRSGAARALSPARTSAE
jgi:GDPmannose 4,6-dehydratase